MYARDMRWVIMRFITYAIDIAATHFRDTTGLGVLMKMGQYSA